MSEAAVTVSVCPACDAADAPQVGSGARGFETVVAGRSFQQPDYAVRGCQACGLYFKSPTLSPAALDAYYAAHESAIFDLDGDFPTDEVLRERLRSVPDGSHILDFGCSTGRILKDHARRLSCVGVEPNPAAAATARSRGINVIPFAQLQGGTETFDAILLTDVFEHLARPVPLLCLLASRLNPGGWLAIVTGNADAAASRTRLAEFWYFRLVDHLIMLSERHLDWLASRLGLRLAAVHRCSHYRLPFTMRVRQQVQQFAYEQFQSRPHGPVARVLGWVPRLSAARHWTTAPAISYRADHVVAFLERPALDVTQ